MNLSVRSALDFKIGIVTIYELLVRTIPKPLEHVPNVRAYLV